MANGNFPSLKVESTNGGPVLSIRNGTDVNYGSLLASNVTSSASMTATNGYVHQLYFTNGYTVCTQDKQVYMVNTTTNPLFVLPDAATVPGKEFVFTTTNNNAFFIITNKTGTQTIRDGVSLAYTNQDNGIKVTRLISDGLAWWLSAKGRITFPCASWSMSTSNLAMTAANQYYAISYDTTEVNNLSGIALGLNATNNMATRMYVTNAGIYMITYSAVINPSHATDVINIWLSQNGSNVPRTNTRFVSAANNAVLCQTVNYFVTVTAPTYFELYCQANNTGCILETTAASGNLPITPAIIVTVNKTSD